MQGLILIPDINGLTHFAKGVDPILGASITQELLSEIIDNNNLGLELSEIEGDAVLYYRAGQPIPLRDVFAGLKEIYEAFNNKYELLKWKYNISAKLSLKFILHYGAINVYYIKGFKKLHGQTIIESHRLLKNGSEGDGYILITQDYIKALGASTVEYLPGKGNFPTFSSQWFTGLGEIGYYLFYRPSHGNTVFQYSMQ